MVGRRKLSRQVWPWLAFIGSLAAYWLTVDPGPSYWDCPEYLVSALRLEVGHPPGNPAWTLTHRFVSSFFSDPAMQIRAVNMMSGLFTAVAAMILCSVCMTLLRWTAVKGERGEVKDERGMMKGERGEVKDESGMMKGERGEVKGERAIGLSSLCGSLCFGWSDSVWYSAVEAEVYAMSVFLTGLTVWMALKWAFSLSRGARARWLIAMAYLMGVSIGVHQLNLLAIPAVALIMAFRLSGRKRLGFWKGVLAVAAGCAVTGFILLGVMPWSLRLASAADILAVNSYGLPYWSGAIAFWGAAIIVAVAIAVVWMRRSYAGAVSMWCLAAVMCGFSVYILIPIRARANPPVNTGSPSSPMRFADYLDRRQYGGAPLFYGRTPFSEVMRLEKMEVTATGDTLWDYSRNALRLRGRDYRPVAKGARIPSRSRFLTEEDRVLNSRLMSDTAPHGYGVAGFRLEEIYTPELDMWLPRIHSGAPGDFRAYGDWTGMDSANMVRVRVSEAFDSLGRPVPRRDAAGEPLIKESLRPTYLQNLTYLLGYQIGYMYLRYLMWNFAGRQNDVPSTGEIEHGNFLTGIRLADSLMLADQRQLPAEIGQGNPGRTILVFPFLAGVAGIVCLACSSRLGSRMRRRRTLAVSTVLFLMTGLAIVFYLNQTPGEPRERDYSFLGSFWTFGVWIAFGAFRVMTGIRRDRWYQWKTAVVSAILLLLLPVNELIENYRFHDRTGRSATLDYASNLLESMPKDAILIVDGDNYIFPLWLAQEVAGIRRDVSVVCDAYLGSDWYVAQLPAGAPDNDGIRMTAKERDIAYGNCNLVRMPSATADTMEAVEAMRKLYADDAPMPRFPARYLRIGKDSAEWVFDLLTIPGKGPSSLASLREVALVDIVSANATSRYPRPIYWHDAMRSDKYRGFFPHTRQGLYARRLMPQTPDSVILTDEALDALPRLRWGGADGSMRYAGPDVASQVSGQRAALIRLALSLHGEGRSDLALHVAKTAFVRYPVAVAPYMYRRHADTTFREAPELARVLREAGKAMGDTLAVEMARKIMEEERRRDGEYRRYYESLPPSRRGAVSPATRSRAMQ